MDLLSLRRPAIEPAEDYGFFGPGSITWQVWSYPTSLTVGFQRAVVIEELDPGLVAAVSKTRGIYERPRTRYDRTLRYFAMVAFGDSRSATKVADILVKVHSKAIGTDPVTGQRYDANDPASQLWIHLTAWHSILYAYERYGPGRLSAQEEAQYWRECAVAAELQTCSPDDVPRTREGVREYFEQMRPRLLGSDLARTAMQHLLQAEVMLPPAPRWVHPFRWALMRVLRAGTIATMPHWMRELGGLRQPRWVDVLVRPVLRIAFASVVRSRRLKLAAVAFLSPMTRDVVAPVFYRVPPHDRVVTSPGEARERFGYERPADAHHDLRDRQARRVFDQEAAPSDEGIVESEPVLGTIAR